jgi:hypothetical protein
LIVLIGEDGEEFDGFSIAKVHSWGLAPSY